MPQKARVALSRYFAEIGRKGGRSKTIPSAERQANARRAALARWNPQPSSEASGSRRKPIWEVARELVAAIPESERRKVPADAASQLDHYLYGTRKRKR